MSEFILAADVGTSSLKVAIVDDRGQIARAARRGYATRTTDAGWTDQDPAEWLSALRLALADLSVHEEYREVRGIILTGQMSAALLVDRDGNATTRCIIWSDQRAEREASNAAALAGPESIYRVTGNPPTATYTAPKLAWLKEHAKSAFDAAAAFVQPKDWIVGQLTGRIATDPSDASCTNLFDLKGGRWDAELFRLFEIPLTLAPEIVPSASIVGRVSTAAASALGLPAGLPVAMGGGDGPMTAIGNGVSQSGSGYLALGTSAWISVATDGPRMELSSGLATFAHVIPGLFVETGAMQAAGGSLEWVSRLFGLSAAHAAEIALAHPPPVGAAPIFLPYLQGERTPYWTSQPAGALFGLNPDHGRDEVVSAVFEGVLFHLRLLVEHFVMLGYKPEVLPISGGFGASAAFSQRLADVLERPVAMLRHSELSTAIGAAIVGLDALGISNDFANGRAWPGYHSPMMPSSHGPEIGARYEVFRQSWADNQAMAARLAAVVQC